jgi:valyl-tRNA synthetase
VGYSERTNVPIEPRLSMQWFLKMKHFADMALPPVMNDELKFYPAKYKNTYRNWLENIKDWCISRQLWWGHRIPAYYLPTGGYVVAENIEEAVKLAQEKTGDSSLTASDLRQDEDALDTWFSSWLWPISLFDGINNPGNEEIKYYYPTNDLVTGPDIIFFWVARMIMAGYEYMGDMPFKNVYFTGIVRDKLGRKMSKSLGNSPDPLDLIERFGADGVRMGMMLSAPAGNDILFDEALCQQGAAFCNKIWNAFRLVSGWEVADIEQPISNKKTIAWFNAVIKETNAEIEDLFSKYRLSEALMAAFKLFTDEFSGWYLEMIKPAYQAPIDKETLKATLSFFELLMKIIHPFMPFISEELWQHLAERKDGESIMVNPLTVETLQEEEKDLLEQYKIAKQIISGVRAVRSSKNIAQKETMTMEVVLDNPEERNITRCPALGATIKKMANLSEINYVSQKGDGSASFMVGTTEYAVPLGNLIDTAAEIEKAETEIKRLEGFLAGIMKKLSNEKFTAHAPAQVVELERKKKADAESKIASLKESVAALKK